MSNGWDKYADAAEAGPKRLVRVLFWPVVGLIALCIVLGIIGNVLGWFGAAAQVAREEFGPREALAKYEWFKDASAGLDKKLADVKVYAARIGSLDDTYSTLPRQNWPREDREQYNIWQSEVAGVTASYNTLAAEYNSAMAKFNWRFANRGMLPEGATTPLPREYKPYEEGA